MIWFVLLWTWAFVWLFCWIWRFLCLCFSYDFLILKETGCMSECTRTSTLKITKLYDDMFRHTRTQKHTHTHTPTYIFLVLYSLHLSLVRTHLLTYTHTHEKYSTSRKQNIMYEWLETHWELLNRFTATISFVCMKRQYDGQHPCLGQRTQSGSLASAASPTLDTLEFGLRTYAKIVREVSNTRHVRID